MANYAHILAALLLPAAALLVAPCVSAEIIPTPEQLLNDYGTTDSGDIQVEDWDAEITTDGAGNFVAIWTSNSLPTSSPDNYSVRMVHAAYSTDGGATWSAPAQLNVIDPEDGSVNGIHPHIVTDGGGTWIASWASGSMWISDASTTDIVISRSTNNGQTWSTPAAIPHPEGGTTRAKDYPAIAADGAGNWVAVWHASVPTNSDKDIYASSSSDNGVTWSSAIMINSNGATDGTSVSDAEPSIATDSAGNWLAVWHSNGAWDGQAGSSDKDIVLSKSADNGATWSVEALVNSNSADTTGPDLHPMIATDGQGNWLTCWYNESGVSKLVAISRSTDIGASWSTLTTPTAGISTNYGRLATDGTGHWLLMARKSSGFMLQQSTDAGLNWSSKLSTTQGLYERDNAVAIGADGAAVALHSDTTARGVDIFFHHSSDSGATWGERARLDVTSVLELPATDAAPLLATDGNGVWVSAWTTRYGSSDETHAAYAIARSDDDGDSWSPSTLIPVPGMNYDTRAVKTDLVTDGAGTWLLPVVGGIAVLRSEDNGLTWSDPIPVSELFGIAANIKPNGNVALASNRDGVWIMAAEVYSEGNTWVYPDTDIYLSRSEDDGLTWSAPLPAAAYMTNDSGWAPDNRAATEDYTPAIAADGAGGWVVSWNRASPLASPGVPRVFSNDNGLTWSVVADIDTRGLTQQVEEPVVRADGAGNWLACWLVYTRTSSSPYRAAPYQVYAARSTNGGATWTAPQLLDDAATSDTPKQDLDLAMGADGHCLVTWSSEAFDGDLDVFAVHSTDSGATWTSPVLLNSDAESEEAATDRGARIASAGTDKWMVVWESDHDLTNGRVDDADIHYTRIGDGWQVEGELEGVVEGVVEGSTEGDIEGDLEGVIDGEGEGASEGEVPGVGIIEGELDVAEETDLTENNGRHILPRIATDSAGNWVAVMEGSATVAGGSDPEIFSMHSTNQGATWSAPVLVNSDGAADNDHDLFPVIATDGAGTWIAAWVYRNKIADNTYEDGYPRCSRSTDNGATWSSPANVGDLTASGSINVQLAYSGDGHWVAVWHMEQSAPWTDDNVFGAYSDDNGVTWSAAVQIVPNRPSQYSKEISPVVACDGNGNCIVAFEFEPKVPPEPEPTGYNRVIKFVRSVDHGHTWSEAGVLDTNGYSGIIYDSTPTLAAGADGLWLACWYESGHMMLSRSTDEGTTWSGPLSINRDIITSLGVSGRHPRLSSYGGNSFALVYSQYRATVETAYNVAASYSTDGGLNWKRPTVINTSANSAVASMMDQWPDVAVADDNVAVVIWTGQLDLVNNVRTNYKLHSTSFELIPWVVEGEPEGNSEGAFEGILEGNTEGVAEGIEEGDAEGAVEGLVEGNSEGATEGVEEGSSDGEGEGEPAAPHSIDLDGNGELSLTEVLRAIQLYNAGGFACALESAPGEDGFTPGDGDHSCNPHSGDYRPQDWIFSISELLRMIQFYNLGGMYPCGELSEDGFCSGTPTD